MSPVPTSSLRNPRSVWRRSRLLANRCIYETFKAYLLAVVISRVLATKDFAGSKTRMIPDQSGLRSVDLQFGHTFPIVTTLHFLQAFSFAINPCHLQAF